jgi:predicted permease
MMRLRAAWRNLVNRDRVERDLQEEVRAAFDLLVEEKRRAGMSVADATRAAAVELRIESVKEQVRDIRAGSFVETLLQDIRYAARLLRRNPLFALTAALSLAIGIGGTTAMFTVANGLLLSVPPGVSDPSGLVEIARVEEGAFGIHPIEYSQYLQVQSTARTLQGVYGYELNLEPLSLQEDAGSERVFGNFVTISFFDVLGVRAASGRLFGRGDREVAGGSPVAVLSHGFWTRRFNRDPSVVGRTFAVNGYPLTVVGVAEERFRGMSVLAPDLWIPAVMIPALKPDTFVNFSAASGPVNWQLMMGGRLARGVSRSQAAAEVGTIGAGFELAAPPKIAMDMTGESIVVPAGARMVWRVTASSPIPSGLRLAAAGFIALLTSLVSVVLVIACANLAGVLLARGTVRRREIAVRVAIGAARARLLRQLLTETVLLFVLGGAAGLLLARGMTSWLVSLLPEFPLPVNLSVPLDGRVVAFTLALSFVAALLSGLAPALHASKSDVVSSLKDDSPGPMDRLRLRNAFVVAQVAFSILLVIVAALLVRGLSGVSNVDRGFDPRRVETASLDMTMAGSTAATGPVVVRELLERVRALPGVQQATLADRAPGAGGMSLGGLTVPGAAPPNGKYFFANWTIVESGYFATLRVPMIAGRDFTAEDREGSAQVAIVGESAARRFWPGQDAVGRTVFVTAIGPFGGGTPAPLTVVGVVGDVRGAGPDSRTPLNVYAPLRQNYRAGFTILARTADGRRLSGELRAVVSSINPNLPVLEALSLENRLDGPVETQLRIAAAVAGSVGLVGLVLAAIGIYGVTAYAVTRRTREIGVRLSLGANRATILGMVVRQGVTLIAVGSAIGLSLGVGAGRILSGARFGLRPPDLPLLCGVLALFAIVGLVACYVPARRATQIAAMQALRYE